MMNSKLPLLSFILVFLVVVIVNFGILFPIYNKVGSAYPFYVQNLTYILIFVLCFAYIFFWRLLPGSDSKRFKQLQIGLALIGIVYVISSFRKIQSYLDEYGYNPFLEALDAEEFIGLLKFIRTELVFFVSAAVILLCIIIPLNIRRIWRHVNR